MNNIARGHHWISQTYLARFTADGTKGSQLHVIDLDRKKWFETAPANVCKKRDFNRIESPELPEGALETSLAKFEDLVAKAMDRILAAPHQIAWRDFGTILNFMAMLAARNPILRAHTHKLAGEHWVKMLWDATDTPEKYATAIAEAKAAGHVKETAVVDFEAHKSFVERREFTVEFPAGYLVPHEFKYIDDVLKKLAAMRWKVLRAPPGSGGFVTTDRPVILIRRDGVHPSPANPVDFGSRNCLVMFPLSPTLLAVGSPVAGDGRVPLIEATKDFAPWANLTIIRVCHGMVFAPHANFEVKPPNGNGSTVVGDEILQLFGKRVDA